MYVGLIIKGTIPILAPFSHETKMCLETWETLTYIYQEKSSISLGWNLVKIAIASLKKQHPHIWALIYFHIYQVNTNMNIYQNQMLWPACYVRKCWFGILDTPQAQDSSMFFVVEVFRVICLYLGCKVLKMQDAIVGLVKVFCPLRYPGS